MIDDETTTVSHENIDALEIGEVRKAMMHKHLEDGLCPAILWHGPGHQSATFCEEQLPHDIHCAVYGHLRQYAEWRGLEAMTGFFDEPPELD